MKNYKYLSDGILARIDEDGKSRQSCTLENREYLAWVAEGNTADPADPYAPSLAEARTRRKGELKQEAKVLFIEARDDLTNSDADITALRSAMRSTFQTAKNELNNLNGMDSIENHAVVWPSIP